MSPASKYTPADIGKREEWKPANERDPGYTPASSVKRRNRGDFVGQPRRLPRIRINWKGYKKS